MKSHQKITTTDLKSLANKVDAIISLCDAKIAKREGYKYATAVEGDLNFYNSGSTYYFETIEEFREALALEAVDDTWLWRLKLTIRESHDKEYTSTNKIDVSFNHYNDDRTNIDISGSAFSFARQLMDEILDILGSEYYVKDPGQEQVAQREHSIKRSVAILEKLPDFQARISHELASEKDVQDFLFPILKSHFDDLQEEDYLAKVAGTASKPDFGIESLGIAFEVKYTSRSSNFKKLADEIAIDSRKYFGKGSPFVNLIVIIYNGSSEPIPANYIADLEHIDVISKVIISPKITPKTK